ncbi:unnamed protein product [Blepharisma stoltei]|uniref:Uncharacterized protein n=1 Tax=Blepharisma stoltei TaxID=1481888 RepID=A0AAU9J3G3_9CILI|nr:unnamed protein product [Blepharisma stoltei]
MIRKQLYEDIDRLRYQDQHFQRINRLTWNPAFIYFRIAIIPLWCSQRLNLLIVLKLFKIISDRYKLCCYITIKYKEK